MFPAILSEFEKYSILRPNQKAHIIIGSIKNNY